jgi:transcriptional regulator of met regulon
MGAGNIIYCCFLAAFTTIPKGKEEENKKVICVLLPAKFIKILLPPITRLETLALKFATQF